MLVRTLFATCLLLCAMAESAWSSNDMRAEVSCSVLLDALVAKVEANYPGYHIEVRGTPREQAYRQHVSTTAAKAGALDDGLDCVRLLQAYVGWFEDGHLFVSRGAVSLSPDDSAGLRDAAPRVGWREADMLSYFNDTARLDPIEGIWVDPSGLRLAIARSDRAGHASGATSFLGVVLNSSLPAWKTGDVKAEFERLPDGSYDAVMYDDARVATHPNVPVRGAAGGARLQREGLLLHMAPVTWGRLHPVRPGIEGHIDPLNPRAPTARIAGDNTVVFHIPSHVPSHAARLHLLVDQFRGALARADNLIIDLRGNEGGSSTVTRVLMPFLVTAERRPARYLGDGSSAVLASEDNAKAFAGMNWVPAGLAARVRDAEPGSLVPFADPQTDARQSQAARVPDGDAPSARAVLPRPRNVAILMDSMTVSAAEAFILEAMRYEKVTLFGQPSGGAIDYQSVNMVRFGPRESGLLVGYPTIIGSDMLPRGAVRPTGIVPDVALDPADPDPVLRIVEYYGRGGGAGE